MLESIKGSPHLDVREMLRPIHGGDTAAQPPDEAQVPGAPFHLVTQLDEAGGLPGHRLLVRVGEGTLVQVQIAREVEDALRGGRDPRFEPEACHERWRVR